MSLESKILVTLGILPLGLMTFKFFSEGSILGGLIFGIIFFLCANALIRS